MSLLPLNSTAFEREIERSLHRVNTLDVNAIRRMRDPWACSTSHLPFLAWGRGVDLWYEDWPEYLKRRMTADIYRLKGLKGTLPGVDGYLHYVGGRIIESVLPPQDVIARPQSADRIRQFKERFAQIRLYPFATRGGRSATVAKVTGPTLAIPQRAVAHGRDIGLVYGRRAMMFDRGVETPVRSIDTFRITGDGVIPVTSFAVNALGRITDAAVGRGVVGRMTAGQTRGRLIIIGAGALAAAVPAGFEGADVLNSSPERIYERHAAKARQPVGSNRPLAFVGSMISRHNEADQWIYDRWHLFDRDRAPSDAYRTLGPVVGRMVPSLLPHHALIRVDARYRSPGRTQVTGHFIVGKSASRPQNDRLLRIGAAIFRSKALHDTVRFTTRTHRPMSIDDLSFDRPVNFSGMVPINRSIQ